MTQPLAPPALPWARLLLVGGLGGLLSGAFGVGGGILMVPLLITFAALDQRRAATTSLAAIIPASVVGGASYLAQGSVDLAVAGLVAVGGVAGSYLGARLLRRLPLPALRWAFIVLLLGVAVRMLLTVPERGELVALDAWTGLGLVVTGLLMGVAAGLFGIGGGVLLVPALIAVFGSDDLVAKGTSLVVMLPTAIMGTWTNLRGGIVDLRVAGVVGVAAAVASLAGVALAFWLPPRLSAVLFATLVLVSAAQLTWRALRSRG